MKTFTNKQRLELLNSLDTSNEFGLVSEPDEHCYLVDAHDVGDKACYQTTVDKKTGAVDRYRYGASIWMDATDAVVVIVDRWLTAFVAGKLNEDGTLGEHVSKIGEMPTWNELIESFKQ